MHTFILLVASNWEAHSNIAKAIDCLKHQFPDEMRCSQIHESEAEGATTPLTPIYLNAVCAGKTPLSQDEMERWLKDTENALGRVRGEAAMGRVAIDLDLVVWDDRILRPIDASRSYYLTCLEDLEHPLGGR